MHPPASPACSTTAAAGPGRALQEFLQLGFASGLLASIAAGVSVFPEIGSFLSAFMLYGG